MNKDQISGILDRAITVLAVMFLNWMVTKGWIGQSESAQLLPAVILLPVLIWGYLVNSNTALAQSAANIPGTIVVTTKAIADATPDQKNIISNEAPKEHIAAAVDKAVVETPIVVAAK